MAMKPTSSNAKQLICEIRSGVLVYFAFSGLNSAASAFSATRESPGSRVGGFTIASPVCWADPPAPRTASYFIRSVTAGSIASVFTHPNRVPFRVAFEGLELCERKLSCTVLRGPDRRNPVRLLGAYCQLIPAIFQQLNFAEWPQFCDHSVTSADVRLSVGPNLSRAACQRPVDFRQSQAWTGGPSERKSALTSGCPLYGRKPRSPRNEFRFAGRIGDHFHPRAATIWYVFRVGQHKKE